VVSPLIQKEIYQGVNACGRRKLNNNNNNNNNTYIFLWSVPYQILHAQV
jgi:hypothetical protein